MPKFPSLATNVSNPCVLHLDVAPAFTPVTDGDHLRKGALLGGGRICG
jgi:hypothetical protein